MLARGLLLRQPRSGLVRMVPSSSGRKAVLSPRARAKRPVLAIWLGVTPPLRDPSLRAGYTTLRPICISGDAAANRRRRALGFRIILSLPAVERKCFRALGLPSPKAPESAATQESQMPHTTADAYALGMVALSPEPPPLARTTRRCANPRELPDPTKTQCWWVVSQ